MKTTITTLALAALLVAGACSNDQNASRSVAETEATPVAAPTANQELTPEELGELGAEIGRNPDAAETLLARHGLDEQKFEQAIRKIAESPDASKRYAESYRKKSA